MIDLLRQRISVRDYTDQNIEPKTRDLLEEALLRSPTSRNRRPWTFIVVEDAPTLEALSRCKPHGAAFIKKASLAVVIAANPELCDVWIEDCSIAATVLQLTAQSLGVGSCWVQIRERRHDESRSSEDYTRSVLQLHPSLKIEAIVSLGYPVEPFKEREVAMHTQKIIHWSENRA